MISKVIKSKKLGEISLILCGILFFFIALLDFWAGQPPAQGTEILNWIERSKYSIAFSNEFLFFAIVFMIPGVRSLNDFLIKENTNSYSFGCGIMNVVISLWMTLLVVQGRLIFPVFNLHTSPFSAELLVGLWYGGLHAVYLLMAGAMVLIGFDMRKITYGKQIAYLSFITGISDFVGGYPWLIGRMPMLISQLLFSFWFLVVGLKLYKLGNFSTTTR